MNHKGEKPDGDKGANRVLHCEENKNLFHRLCYLSERNRPNSPVL